MKRSLLILPLAGLALMGCAHPEPPYGREGRIILAANKPQSWAVAPAINLSGQRGVDPLLQADLLYQQLQQVQGLTVIPVDRVVPVLVSLGVDQIRSPEEAAIVCDLLKCDGLIVPTVTAYDPYNPPKVGASLQLFTKPNSYSRPENVDPRELVRRTRPAGEPGVPASPNFIQSVGMFDAANGTTRDALKRYAAGRYDPKGAYKEQEYFVSMDRYTGFVYRQLIEGVLDQMYQRKEAPSMGQ
jgi:hypothetical protein